MWRSDRNELINTRLVFGAQRYASAVLAIAIAPCAYVCLSVHHTAVLYGNDWTDRAGCWHDVPISGLRKLRHGKSIVLSRNLVDSITHHHIA